MKKMKNKLLLHIGKPHKQKTIIETLYKRDEKR